MEAFDVALHKCADGLLATDVRGKKLGLEDAVVRVRGVAEGVGQSDAVALGLRQLTHGGCNLRVVETLLVIRRQHGETAVPTILGRCSRLCQRS